MNDPPVPGKPGDWANLLAYLTFSNPSGGLGFFVDGRGVHQYIAAVRDPSSGATVWKLDSTAPSGGVVETLLTSATANILKNGATNANGTVTHGGTTYTIKLYDGTCKAV